MICLNRMNYNFSLWRCALLLPDCRYSRQWEVEDDETHSHGHTEADLQVLVGVSVDQLQHLHQGEDDQEDREPVGQDRLVEHEVDGCEDVLTVDVQPDPAGQARQVDDAVAGSAGVDGDL